MAVINPEDTLVLVGASSAGPFAPIADMDAMDNTRTRGDVRRRFVFGSDAAYIKPGDKESSYTISGFYNPADTNGQNVIEAAFESGDDIVIVVAPDGAAGWMEEGKVTEYTVSAEREGEYVEVSFTFEGNGVRTAYDADAE